METRSQQQDGCAYSETSFLSRGHAHIHAQMNGQSENMMLLAPCLGRAKALKSRIKPQTAVMR